MTRVTKVGLLAAGIALAPLTASADTLSWATGWATASPIYAVIEDHVQRFHDVAGIDVRHFPLQQLLTYTEMVSGLREGIADMGFVLFPYTPNEFPNINLVSDLGTLATGNPNARAPGEVMTAVMLEYVMLHCPDCLTELAAQNQVFLSAGGGPANQTLCDRPVTHAADLNGLRIRTGAPGFGRFAESMGATRVAISGTEIYDAFSTHAIDCTYVALPELLSLRLIEVVSHITLGSPGGTFAAVGSANMNRDTWESLEPATRENVLRVAAHLSASIAVAYDVSSSEARRQAEATGVVFHQAEPDLLAATAAFAESDLATISQQYSANYGVTDVDAKIAIIRGLIDRWVALADPVMNDPDALAELFWNEIYAHVDATTYGLN